MCFLVWSDMVWSDFFYKYDTCLAYRVLETAAAVCRTTIIYVNEAYHRLAMYR